MKLIIKFLVQIINFVYNLDLYLNKPLNRLIKGKFELISVNYDKIRKRYEVKFYNKTKIISIYTKFIDFIYHFSFFNNNINLNNKKLSDYQKKRR